MNKKLHVQPSGPCFPIQPLIEASKGKNVKRINSATTASKVAKGEQKWICTTVPIAL